MPKTTPNPKNAFWNKLAELQTAIRAIAQQQTIVIQDSTRWGTTAPAPGSQPPVPSNGAQGAQYNDPSTLGPGNTAMIMGQLPANLAGEYGSQYGVQMPQPNIIGLARPKYGIQLFSDTGDLVFEVNQDQGLVVPSVSGYASLTGPGETATPGALTQAGDFEVDTGMGGTVTLQGTQDSYFSYTGLDSSVASFYLGSGTATHVTDNDVAFQVIVQDSYSWLTLDTAYLFRGYGSQSFDDNAGAFEFYQALPLSDTTTGPGSPIVIYGPQSGSQYYGGGGVVAIWASHGNPETFITSSGSPVTPYPQLENPVTTETFSPTGFAFGEDGKIYSTINAGVTWTAATGTQGPQGAQGAQGPQGPQGPSGGIASITGAGVTTTPGDLVQAGGFTVNEAGSTGINFNDDGAGGINLTEASADGSIVIQTTNSSNASGINIQDAGESGVSIYANGTGQVYLSSASSSAGMALLDFGTGGVNIQFNSTGLLGFFGAAPVVQPAAPASPTGGVVVDTQARAAIDSLIAILSAALGGNGLTA